MPVAKGSRKFPSSDGLQLRLRCHPAATMPSRSRPDGVQSQRTCPTFRLTRDLSGVQHHPREASLRALLFSRRYHGRQRRGIAWRDSSKIAGSLAKHGAEPSLAPEGSIPPRCLGSGADSETRSRVQYLSGGRRPLPPPFADEAASHRRSRSRQFEACACPVRSNARADRALRSESAFDFPTN